VEGSVFVGRDVGYLGGGAAAGEGGVNPHVVRVLQIFYQRVNGFVVVTLCELDLLLGHIDVFEEFVHLAGPSSIIERFFIFLNLPLKPLT